MAYHLLDELKEQTLTCQLCFEVPGGGAQGDTNVFKQLSCSHIFCKSCIQKWTVAEGYCRGIITCPNCRKKIRGNVDALPSAFQVTNVIEWINKKQQDKSTNRVCREHGVQLNFFCLDCSAFVCGDGLRLSQSHEEHTTLYVKTEAEPIRKAAQDMMEEIKFRMGHWKKAHEEVRGMISSIDDDTSKALELLEKYTEEIKKSLISAQDLLRKTIMNTQKKKIEVLEKEKYAIIRKIQEIEKKILEHQESMKKADEFEVFNEHVAITKMRQEFLRDQLPDTTQMTKQTEDDSLRFAPNFISLRRLKNDIAHFGKVHNKSEKSLKFISTSYSKGLSRQVLKTMEDVVKEAYELDLSNMEKVEDRRTKLTFIVKHLEDVLEGEWNCILGDFERSQWPVQVNKTVNFLVNDTDNVIIYKLVGVEEQKKYEKEVILKKEEYSRVEVLNPALKEVYNNAPSQWQNVKQSNTSQRSYSKQQLLDMNANHSISDDTYRVLNGFGILRHSRRKAGNNKAMYMAAVACSNLS
ncbi:uncharacterized protein [Antedon mediterranea]|uniref:uncharacterized protein n=1 Tax=Antedon mediterranea TaxID=105859 RepID=UPI003AF6B5DF